QGAGSYKHPYLHVGAEVVGDMGLFVAPVLKG
ncbi:hypothetical protein LCGC14_2049310, partial [marine sediment metagenome]